MLRQAAASLAEAGIDSPTLEARLLMAHALGIDRSTPMDRSIVIDPTVFNGFMVRRLAHEPLAFITGRQGFWTLDVEVSRDTLIPRADSETLIQAGLNAREGCETRRILDLGTGTGCLLLAALEEFPLAFGVGVDLSPGAARLAARNAQTHGFAARSAFLAGSWADALQGKFDLVLSNPPYIRADDIPSLMPEVASFEPMRALDGGADGLCAYRALMDVLPALLAPNGHAILELGFDQSDAVTDLAAAKGLRRIALKVDLGGIGRALVLQAEKTFGNTTRSV